MLCAPACILLASAVVTLCCLRLTSKFLQARNKTCKGCGMPRANDLLIASEFHWCCHNPATFGKTAELYGCMICISLLSLVSAAALIVCIPYWSRTFFQSKCTCPAVPICPDCGMPF
uniref:SFRICE_008660 n=1 Tax=Spodoptera frugiperda TaxID=7108 RepID=A0A2H1VE04_SPOFR